MTRHLTPAERLASAEKDLLLENLAEQSSWDRFLVEQAVFHYGTRHDEWSANDLRDVQSSKGRDIASERTRQAQQPRAAA